MGRRGKGARRSGTVSAWTTVLGSEHEHHATLGHGHIPQPGDAIVSVHPLLESLCEAKEEAVAAENETGHRRDLTMPWEKGFLFMGIQSGFF